MDAPEFNQLRGRHWRLPVWLSEHTWFLAFATGSYVS